jgi:hypothetical protein
MDLSRCKLEVQIQLAGGRAYGGAMRDDVRATWPCKYEVRTDYERHYFQRREKRLDTRGRCAPRAATVAQVEREMESLLAALRQWAKENPGHLEEDADTEEAGADTPDVGADAPASVPPWTELIDEIFAPGEEEAEPGLGVVEVPREPYWYLRN